MRVVRWLMFALLLAAVVGSVWVLQQRRLGSPVARYLGSAVVSGSLSERPILFATANYRLMPTTAQASEGRLAVPQNRARRDGRPGHFGQRGGLARNGGSDAMASPCGYLSPFWRGPPGNAG